MKLKIILVLMLSLLSVLAVGCSSIKENTLAEEGKLALEQHDYQKARGFLSDALEADSTDEYARAMYIQAVRMENAKEYEDQGNYKEAIEELEIIDEIKNGLSSIKSEALDKKKELIKLNEEYVQAKIERKENAKTVSSKDKYRVEEQAVREQQRQFVYLEEKKKEEENKTPENTTEEGIGNQDVVISPPIQ
ncbi:MAG: hypothetical protein ACRC3Y_16615 [Romboutsia sp.]|uniref:hypothetical protein n=1 Tax=Romboutsia sp. TaxID=1965302 RepID=UPI003F38FD48